MKMKTIMARAGSLDNTFGRWSRFFTRAATCGNTDWGTKGVGSGVKAVVWTVLKKGMGNHAPSSSRVVDGVLGVD